MAGRQTASFGCDFCTLCAGSHCLTGLWTLSGYFLAKRLLALGKRHVLGSESVCSPQTLDIYIYIYVAAQVKVEQKDRESSMFCERSNKKGQYMDGTVEKEL